MRQTSWAPPRRVLPSPEEAILPAPRNHAPIHLLRQDDAVGSREAYYAYYLYASASCAHPQPLCYLFGYTPSRYRYTKSRPSGFISAVGCELGRGFDRPRMGITEVETTQYISAIKRGLEWDIDRPGMDFMEVWTEYPNWPYQGTPEGYQAFCAQRAECQAFTFVHANRVGDTYVQAKCYVKNGVSESQFVPHKGLVSGVKGRDFRGIGL